MLPMILLPKCSKKGLYIVNKTVQELAVLLGGTVIGNGDALIGDVKSLEEAGQNDITFAVDPYTEYLPQVHAGAVIVDKEVPAGDNTLVIVENPRLAFSQLLVLFHPRQSITPGIHPTAIVDESAVIGEDVSIMPYAVIGKNVEIGNGSVIYPYVFLGDHVKIGEGSVLYPGAVIHEHCVLGKNAVIRAHAVIGGEGFGFATEKGSIPAFRRSETSSSVTMLKLEPAPAWTMRPWGRRRLAEVLKSITWSTWATTLKSVKIASSLPSPALPAVPRPAITLSLPDRRAVRATLRLATTLSLPVSQALSAISKAIRPMPGSPHGLTWNGAALRYF